MFVFFNENKIRKIPRIFDIENWLWKSNFGLLITPIGKIKWFHLTTVNFYPKTFLILYPSFKNSTTGIVIDYLSNERFPYLGDLSTDNESVTKLKIIHTCTPKVCMIHNFILLIKLNFAVFTIGQEKNIIMLHSTF